MRTTVLFAKRNFWSLLFVIGLQISSTSFSVAQQLEIKDFTIFAKGTVQIGSSNSINGGSVGSETLVQTTGNAEIKSSIYSGGKISLVNSNIAGVSGGKITAANSADLDGTVISVGSSATINCDVYSRGSMVVGGGTISGTVTVSPGTYTGPEPAGGVNYSPFTPPTLPDFPAVTDLSGYPTVTTNITGNFNKGPGNYGNINFSGNKTLTLNTPGVYVFNSIKMSGNSNKLVFSNTPGNYTVYVKGNADWGKLNSTGGDPSRIFFEVQGNGATASIPNYSFIIANGSSGGASKWLGTVWAPNGGINIGSGTGSSTLTGSLYSRGQINIQSGVSVFYAPFTFCTNPDANAGLDKPLDFSTETRLVGTSTTPGVSFAWQAINGGIISTPPNNDTILVSAAGTYVLTVSSGNCFTRDSVVVSSKIESGGSQKNIIGSELQSIYDNRPQSSPFFFLRNDSVMIDVMVNPGYYDYILNLLQSPEYGLDITPFNDPANTIITNGTSNLIITGLFPIVNLPKLNLLFTEINFCRPYYQAVNYTDFKILNDNPVITGLITSAGDIAMRSDLVRKGYKINGDGIKIGILSNSFATIHSATTATQPFQPITNPPNPIPQTFTTNTAAQDVANGDLPGDTTFSWAVPSHVVNPNGFTKNVHVLRDFPVQLSDEGRAMAQIAHDVAPGSELFGRTGFFTANDCAVGIKELKDAGCKVIVDDITYITEPFFKDGVIAKAVNSVSTQGVSYFSAAGNFANKSYENDFNPIQISSGPLAGKMAHNFGGNDMFQRVRLAPGDYTIVFQWIDDIFSSGELEGTKIDCDGYLVPFKTTSSSVVDSFALFGFNRDNTGGDPIEFIPFTIPAGPDSVDANILFVSSTTGLNPDRFKVVIYRGGARIMEYNVGNSTIVGQANAEGAITIGAARFDKTRPYLNTPQLESFSSIGRTKTVGVLRNKPDLVGPDGVNTTVKLGQDYPNTALDGFSNFFGTSAAAPHAASAAALLMEGRKKFLGFATTTPSEIRSLLQSTAIDMATLGFDSTSGYGFINVDLAMRTIAAPTPSIDSLIIPTTSPITIPGNTVFTVTVKGDNFSSNSILYYNDSALASTVVLNTNEATAIIPMFDDNPGIRMYTPPYPTTILVDGKHLDGGFSNTLFFFQGSITIKAADTTKKYAQQMPPLKAIIKINGTLLEDTTLTLADIGLQNMTITTPATANSDVGTYIVTPSRIFDENNPADVALLQKYNYSFTNGTLTIEKLPLKVTPADKTITQGQYVGNVTFNYDFDHTNISDPTGLINLIKSYHQSYVPNNVLAVIKNFLKTQADGSVLSSNDILNLGIIASFKAVKNSRKFQLSNNELVPVSNPNTFNLQYLLDVASESIYNYKISPEQAQFFNSYPDGSSTAMLSAAALNDDVAKVLVNGSLVKIVNGSLEQTVNTLAGPMAPILNGEFVQIINGELYPVPDGSLIQLANGSLVKIVNGEFVPIANGSLVKLVNGSLVKIVNGDLVQVIDGIETPIISNVTDISSIPNGSLVKIVNGSLVKMVNGSLVKIVNGSIEQILNGSLVKIVNGSLVKIVNGTTLGLGTSTTNNTAVILDQSDVDPLQSNWLGAMFGINMITGLDVGTQWLIPGVLVNSNFDISYGLGKVTINADPCLITHSPDKNFGSSANPGTATSLWLNITTKISGQLKSKGDYLLYKSGTVTFDNITSTPLVSGLAIPIGKIVADNVSVPSTKFDEANNMWITRVPLRFSSTSDIFITGVIINSSTGFVKNNNASTTVNGKFYSNLNNLKDQWGYASAAYQPQFTYASIADSGIVTSINGTYRAATPTSQITNLVSGGSGGGGNNYSGSIGSYDKFTACVLANSAVNRPVSINDEIPALSSEGQVQIIPNPAKNYINLSFIPATTANFETLLFTIDGKKIFEVNNGICEAGTKYMKKIDVSKLVSGIYVVQLKSNDKIIIKKIVIER
jgi:hypothetical protein